MHRNKATQRTVSTSTGSAEKPICPPLWLGGHYTLPTEPLRSMLLYVTICYSYMSLYFILQDPNHWLQHFCGSRRRFHCTTVRRREDNYKYSFYPLSVVEPAASTLLPTFIIGGDCEKLAHFSVKISLKLA